MSRLAVLLAVSIIAAGLLCAGQVRAGAPVVLKMNHQFPENTTGSRIDQWFADQVRIRSRGRLTINVHWSNGLGEPRDNLSLISRGVLDMAAMSAGYFPDKMPMLAAPNSIPMAMDNVCQAREIMKALLKKIPEVADEAAELGVRPLFFHVLNPYMLATRTPVTRLEDLKGMRIRTWGEDLPGLIRAAGAKPVPLFLPDVYPALEKGVIDGCPFSLDLMVSYGIYKLAKHVTEVIMWEGPSWGVWISESVWARLPDDIRDIMAETAEEAGRMEIRRMLAAEKEARTFLLSRGVEFHSFSETEKHRWQASSPDYFGKFIRKMSALGKAGAAAKMVDVWQTMRQTTTCP